MEAYQQSKVNAESEVDAVALEMICLDYMAGPRTTYAKDKKGKAPSLKSLMKKDSIEDVLGMVEEVFPTVEISAEITEDD